MNITKISDIAVMRELIPENIRIYYDILITIAIFSLSTLIVLKILLTKEFKTLYKFLNKSSILCIKTLQISLEGAATSVHLPQRYPRIEKSASIGITCLWYTVSAMLAALFISVFIISIITEPPSLLAHNARLLALVLIGYFSLFFFAQAEKERLKPSD